MTYSNVAITRHDQVCPYLANLQLPTDITSALVRYRISRLKWRHGSAQHDSCVTNLLVHRAASRDAGTSGFGSSPVVESTTTSGAFQIWSGALAHP
jgi:hypothetical protein